MGRSVKGAPFVIGVLGLRVPLWVTLCSLS